MNGLEEGRHRMRLAALLSCLVIGLIFWGLFQIDFPFARFLRSLHIGWLERTGDLGTRLGSGAALMALSAGLLAGGWLSKQPHIRAAGYKTLLAHGVAALTAQTLKHGLGRPRPRLVHADNEWTWRPTLESGLDSFPSGHTTASFAVAVVLAKSFPRMAWLVYGLAGFVAVSRTIRGSHFPTDVLAGICLGTIAGMSVLRPIREWNRLLLETTAQFLPYLALVFSLLWLSTHSPPQAIANPMMVVGIMVITIGVAMRICRAFRWILSMKTPVAATIAQANRIIVIGAALTTGLWLVTAVAGMLGVIQWFLYPEAQASSPVFDKASAALPRYWTVLAEVSLMAAIALAVVIIQLLKGRLLIL